jgi:hypothetical protein
VNENYKDRCVGLSQPAAVEGWKPTHAEVVAWNERNGGWFQGRIDEARCAIDDARSMHLLSAAPTPPSAPVQQSVREALQLLHEHAQLYLPNYNDRQNVYDTVTSALSTSPLLDKNDQAEGEVVAYLVVPTESSHPLFEKSLTFHKPQDRPDWAVVPLYSKPPQPDINELVEAEIIGDMRENGVTWYGKNPHAFPVGTKFYALAQSPSVGQKGEE